MRTQTLIRKLLPVLVVMALAGALAPASGPTAAQGANLLRNPSFEGQYSAYKEGDRLYVTAQMAPDWLPWWVPQVEGDPSWKNRMPEWKSSAPFQNRIRSGATAQQYFTFYGTHIGGVWQRVPVTAGAQLRFSVWVQVWSSAFDDPNVSENNGQVNVRVGIDPTGGTDPFSATVVWSNPKQQYDEWFEMSVEARAASNNATVFVRTEPQFPVKHNDIYLDDAALVVVGAQPPTPTPTSEVFPTVTPSPTFTKIPVITNTPVPGQPTATPIGTVIYTVVPGDTLSGIARRYGTTVSAIMAANGLTGTIIYPGQQLKIPTTQVPPTAPPPTGVPPTTAPGQPTTYVVQGGDTLFRIARRFGVTVEALAAANGIVNPNLIRVGQVLQIGSGGSQPPPPPPPTGPRTHVVQRGETAFRIALRYGVTVEALAARNGIVNPNLIFAGQVLVIP